MKLETFISRAELAAMTPEQKKQAAEQIQNTPPFYATEEQGETAKVALHYFMGGSDWFFTEINHETGEAFGFVCLNGWKDCAELGYSYIPELIALGVELDLYWNTNRTLADVKAEILN